MYLLLILDLIFFFVLISCVIQKCSSFFSCVCFFRLFLGTDGDFCFFFSGSTVSTLYGTLWAQLNVM